MSWLGLQTVAQISVERILNALPEGLLIALFAWALLRVLRQQNSGTRFAVWFVALMSVALLPVLSFFEAERASLPGLGGLRPALIIPERWAIFVFLAWAVGAGLAMIRLASGLWRLRQLRRSCAAIDVTDLDPLLRTTIDGIIASGSITVATSDFVRVPAAIGFWKRTIILPTWTLRELPPSDLNVILLHEFAHLLRGDDWTNLIQKVVRALFFFHPAVWWIESQLSVEREMACDDAVLAETANPHGYATCLVSLLEKSLAHRELSLAQAAVHRAREASLRLTKILDKNRPVATRVWKPALGLVGAFSFVCLVALSQVPQFIAVDGGLTASNPARYSAATALPVFQAAQQTAPVIPAPSKIDAALHRRLGAKVAVHRPVQASAPVEAVTAQTTPSPIDDKIVVVKANADAEIAPQFQTLVFIQATQYGNPASSVWRVQVWQITVLTGVRERMARVPVANSI